MANRQNGEVSVEINGKQYTLAMTINAMVALEDLVEDLVGTMRHRTHGD